LRKLLRKSNQILNRKSKKGREEKESKGKFKIEVGNEDVNQFVATILIQSLSCGFYTKRN